MTLNCIFPFIVQIVNFFAFLPINCFAILLQNIFIPLSIHMHAVTIKSVQRMHQDCAILLYTFCMQTNKLKFFSR